MTFRDAAARYIQWARQTKLKNTTRSENFWRRREGILNERVLPVIGDRTMAEMPDIVHHSLEDGVQQAELGGNADREREEALAVTRAVLQHHLTGR